jgi:hypothetical protein
LESLARLPAYGEGDRRLDQDAIPLEVEIEVGD